MFWTHRDDNELIRQVGNQRTLRSKITEEKKQETKKWLDETDAQFGYGEITQVSLQR